MHHRRLAAGVVASCVAAGFVARLGARTDSGFNSYTTITDRTPELLSGMESLERITFDTCNGLTNEGVARLAGLPRLRELRVSGRGVTPDLVKAFPATVRVLCPNT